MTNSEELNSVGGVADGALTQEEIRAQVTVNIPTGNDLGTLAQNITNDVEWSLSSFNNVGRATKFPTDPNIVYFGSGAFSFNPLLGRFLFGNSSNEYSDAAFKVDQKKSIMRSTSSQTTLGSKNIDTVDGYILNQVGAKYPSTHFTPQKTWIRTLFPSFDDELLKVALLEAIQVLLLSALKGTKSEQIVKQTRTDLGTIIVDNQEIEDRILAEART